MFTPRLSGRVLTLRTAKVFVDETSPGAACIVLNVSEGGACLLLSDPLELSETFTLKIDRVATPYHCRVAWKRKNRIGVAFLNDTVRQETAGKTMGNPQAEVPPARGPAPAP